jgi:hypothetical protein
LNRSPPGETIAAGMPTLVESQPILSLRCRDAEWLDCPEVVDAFERPVTALPRERRDLAVTELLLADQQARRWLGAASGGGRTILTCETARFGAAVAFERTQADLADWTRWDELGGDLFFEPESSGSVVELRPRTLAMRVRRSLVAIAAAVPMLTLSIAQASPPPATVVRAAPPKLPEDPAAPPTTTTTTTTTAPAPTEAPRVADPLPAPLVMPMPPPRDDSLSLTGNNLWNGLEDKSLVLIMKDGTELNGTLVAHSGKDLAVARTSDGTVVAVPKLDVIGIRVRASTVADGPVAAGNRKGGTKESGHKLAAGGGAMIGIGSTAALAGSVMLGIYISYLFISLPLLLPGLAMIGGGIGLLASSKKKKAAYEKAWGITSGRNRVMPTFAASRQGGQAGLVLRF